MMRHVLLMAVAGLALLSACGQDDGSNPGLDACGPHGMMQGEQCLCDAGFVEMGTTCVADDDPPVTPPPTDNPPPQGEPGNGGGDDVTRLLPATCFIGPSPCDPRSGEGCDAGASCDFSEGALVCFPPPNDAAIGASCDNQRGPFCAPGSWCMADADGGFTCRKVCCSDDECSEPGFTCVPRFTDDLVGSLGACADARSCLPPGAQCSPANDTCCGSCHLDHCH